MSTSTSSAPSTPTAAAEPAAAGEAAHTQPAAASSSTADAPPSAQNACPWQSQHLSRQECSRYLDCPSHTIERRDSTSHSGRGPAAQDGIDAITTEASENVVDTSGDVRGALQLPDAQPVGHEQSQRNTAAPAMLETPLPTSAGSRDGSATIDHRQSSRSSRTSSVMPSNNIPSRPSSRRSQSHDAPSASSLVDSPRDRHMASYMAATSDEYRTLVRRTSRTGPAFRIGQSSEDGRARPQTREAAADGGSTECLLPRWQPDAEVTYCPICHTQFSIFVRKHHCRKCGRVVCNSCSPHRIIIPHPYIVRPPGSEFLMPSSLLLDGLGAGYFEANGPSGGERVRLCNPCVPDPNTAPPHSPAPSAAVSPRSSHQRSRSNQGSAYGVAHSASAYAAPFPAGRGGDAYQYYSPRWRSVTMGPGAMGPVGTAGSHQVRISATYHSPLERYLSGASSSTAATSRRNRHSSFGEAASSPLSSRHRALPPPPQIAEEDECPICHQELPSRELANFESLRESHVSQCIQAHSTYGSPRGGAGESAAPRRTGMYTYAATEKDCIDDAECTICLEEFIVGVAMARLECLCRFHKACISAWFVNHPGRCPVHQHDGFGF